MQADDDDQIVPTPTRTPLRRSSSRRHVEESRVPHGNDRTTQAEDERRGLLEVREVLPGFATRGLRDLGG